MVSTATNSQMPDFQASRKFVYGVYNYMPVRRLYLVRAKYSERMKITKFRENVNDFFSSVICQQTLQLLTSGTLVLINSQKLIWANVTSVLAAEHCFFIVGLLLCFI